MVDQNQVFGPPDRWGLYDPSRERESCGVGLIAHLKGWPSHRIVLDAHQALRNMHHRGACGCEPNTGDGAGVTTALPHDFLAWAVRRDLGKELPDPGRYAAGLVFLPTDPVQRRHCRRIVDDAASAEGLQPLGWRKVPTEAEKADIGPAAKRAEPRVEQVLIGAPKGCPDGEFERRLYRARKRSSRLVGESALPQARMFHVCSLSSRILVYKGMLTPDQLDVYYPDLTNPLYATHVALVHSRFSTNTFPSWNRAQPMRWMCHNGEINTLRGNKNWFRARQGALQSPLLGDLRGLHPILEPDCSDSGTFDNMLEFLVMAGRPLPEAILMMIPEAWQKNPDLSETRRAFHEFHSCLMEPWDGPALIAFTDGRWAGAALDRNGLRPGRYTLTYDDRVILSSEAGVLPVDPALIKAQGRIEPGRVFLVDFSQGRLVPDDEFKEKVSRHRPYSRWLRQRLRLEDIPGPDTPPPSRDGDPLEPMRAFGYTTETLQFFLLPMVANSRDPIGSMGNDSALACLSDHPRLPYDYFKQLFAQVTNPPIDSIREEMVMTLECHVGPEGNLLDATEDHCRRLLLPHPILRDEEVWKLRQMNLPAWRTRPIDITFARTDGEAGLPAALDRICGEAESAVEAGDALILLTDRAVSAERVPVSALLAVGAVHHHWFERAGEPAWD